MKTSTVSPTLIALLLLGPAAAQTEMSDTDSPAGSGSRMKKSHQELIRRHDKNGDGRLDEAEQAEAAKYRAGQVKKFDRDGDGRLNEMEREDALKAVMDDQPESERKKDR